MAASCREQARDAGDIAVTPSHDTSSVVASAPADACAAAPTRESRLICPHRLGPITAETTRAMLATMFGALRDDTIPLAEGEITPVTIINRGAPDSAIVAWATGGTGVHFITHIGSAWATPHGLRVGSALQDITNAIGPVNVLGLGWDYGGTVMLDGTTLADSGIFFRMEQTAGADNPLAARVRGDSPFPSDDAGVRALRLVVGSIDVMMR